MSVNVAGSAPADRQFEGQREVPILIQFKDTLGDRAQSGVMWPYYPDLLKTAVPRYTSFPTAVEFVDSIGAAEMTAALEQARGEVSLYIHIPFCESICWYCGCNTGAANRRQRLASYLDALHREIVLIGSRLPRVASVRRVAFGGGSPNAIAPTDFVRLMDALTLHFHLTDPLISIELDPRTLHGSWEAVIGGIGATHASLGVQTFSPRLQAAIGRDQPMEDIARSTALLRRAGITSLNFDLMYGLPGQTMDDLADTIETTVTMRPDRVALFGYAHVPHLIPRQRRIDASALPDQEARFLMAELGHRLFLEQGYLQAGFDHFALPGDPLAQAALNGRLHRNFQGFTDDSAPVMIGLGASAISSFPQLITQNEKNSGRYRMMLSQEQMPAVKGVIRLTHDRMRGRIIEGLLCHGYARVDRPAMTEAYPRLLPFLRAGLLLAGDGALTIPPAGLPYARAIAAQFDPYRADSSRPFSSAV
jgi:oxygen-independent coproporphyrinogen-3 oxidase